MTEPVTLLAAILAGLVGSGHCLAMCGPIASLSGASAPHGALPRTLVYNAGRLLSYTVAGALFGGLGQVLVSQAGIGDWAFFLRVGMGAIVLLVGLQLLLPRFRSNPLERLGARFWRRIAPLARRLQPDRRRSHLFALGLLWGWLPCGLVYSMLALAAVSGSAFAGALVMLGFGAGTLPAMTGLGIAGRGLRQLRRPSLRRVLGVALLISGAWLAAMPLAGKLSGGGHAHHGMQMNFENGDSDDGAEHHSHHGHGG